MRLAAHAGMPAQRAPQSHNLRPQVTEHLQPWWTPLEPAFFMRTHYVPGDSGTLWMGLLAIDHTDHPRHQVILIGRLPGRGSRTSTNGSLSSSRPPADTYQLRTQCCSGAKQRATSNSWPGPQESMRSVSSYSSSRRRRPGRFGRCSVTR